MKKAFLSLLLVFTAVFVFAQQLPTVAVATFDITGGITRNEAQVVTELFMTELVSKGSVRVVDRVNFDKIIAEMRFQTTDWSDSQKTAQLGRALNAQYVIRGQLMKMGNVVYWTATMIDVNTAQVLYSAREQMNDLGEIFGKLPAFCAQMIANMPLPNYFIGRWRGTTYDGRFNCILEFKNNGSVVVERYDAYWNGVVSGRGQGSYSFDSTGIRININLIGFPSDAGTRYSSFILDSPYSFDGSKHSFTIDRRGLYVDGNYDYYRTFIKIQ